MGHVRLASAARRALAEAAQVAEEPLEVPAELPLRDACFRDRPPEAARSLRTRTDRSTWELPAAVAQWADPGVEEPVSRVEDLAVDRAHLEEDLAVQDHLAADPSAARLAAVDAGCRRDPGSSLRRKDSILQATRRALDCWGSKDPPEAPAVAAAGAVVRKDSAEADILVVAEEPLAVAAALPIRGAAHTHLVPEVAHRDFAAAPGAVRIVLAGAEVVAAGADPIRVGMQQAAAVPETCRDAARPKRAAEHHTKRRTCSWAYSKCRNAGTRSSSPTSERRKIPGVVARFRSAASIPVPSRTE